VAERMQGEGKAAVSFHALAFSGSTTNVTMAVAFI
jgi:hypothetical protein